MIKSIPFDKDLSRFSAEDFELTLRFLRRGWYKCWIWHLIIPAYIAIRYELEWRKAIEEAS